MSTDRGGYRGYPRSRRDPLFQSRDNVSYLGIYSKEEKIDGDQHNIDISTGEGYIGGIPGPGGIPYVNPGRPRTPQ